MDPWIAASVGVIDSHRRLVDGALSQISDEELVRRPAPGINSIAVILRHLGGNLLSRWTDFLTTDGEKPSRNRDAEFEDWPGDRASLLAFFDSGWQMWRYSIGSLTSVDFAKSVTIRGEPHTVPQAIERSLTHTAYHVGQIMLIARSIHDGDWQWLTIRPGGSQQHNRHTWGTPDSRGMAGNLEHPSSVHENSLISLRLTADELLLLNNALNEVTNGVDIDDQEFSTRLGVSRLEAVQVLKQIHELLDRTVN